MKMLKLSLFSIVMATVLSACSNYQMSIQIPANEKVVIDYPNYDVYMAELQNNSLSNVEVKVISKQNEEWVRGFGLNSMAREKVKVEKENQLVLLNNGKQMVKLKVNIEETKRTGQPKAKKYITFTLQNQSEKSLPLIIPNVMNPNLSPNSNSGVDLQIGQQILFRDGLKKHLLLIVDETIKKGDTLIVDQILAARKKELGL